MRQHRSQIAFVCLLVVTEVHPRSSRIKQDRIPNPIDYLNYEGRVCCDNRVVVAYPAFCYILILSLVVYGRCSLQNPILGQIVPIYSCIHYQKHKRKRTYIASTDGRWSVLAALAIVPRLWGRSTVRPDI